MNSSFHIDPNVIPLLVGLVVLLGVAFATRRSCRKHVLRTICFGCESPFQGHARLDFVGFRVMTCPACGVAAQYPMFMSFVTVYVLVLIFVLVSVVVQIANDPMWRPSIGGIWVLALPFALIVNRRKWRRLRSLAARCHEPVESMQRVARVDAATAGERR